MPNCQHHRPFVPMLYVRVFAFLQRAAHRANHRTLSLDRLWPPRATKMTLKSFVEFCNAPFPRISHVRRHAPCCSFLCTYAARREQRDVSHDYYKAQLFIVFIDDDSETVQQVHAVNRRENPFSTVHYPKLRQEYNWLLFLTTDYGRGCVTKELTGARW